MTAPSPETPTFVEPNIDVVLTPKQKGVCQEILRQIKEVCLSQRQYTFLINLLALELEDRETMLAIVGAVKATRNRTSAHGELEVGPRTQEGELLLR